MRRLLPGLLLPLVVAISACSEATGPAGPDAGIPELAAGEAIPGQYILVFRPDGTDVPGLARKLRDESGGSLLASYSTAVRGAAMRLPEQALAGLSRHPQVAYIEPDVVVGSAGEQPGARWGLDRIDQRSGRDGTFTYANSGAGVSIYVIDTGIRSTHADFGGRVMPGYTSISDGRGTEDCSGHGTHVASAAGGAVWGVAKEAHIYPIRVLDCSNGGTMSGLIAGIDWMVRTRVGPAVANMSLAGSPSTTLNSAIKSAVSAGVPFAVAAGNSNIDACTVGPANSRDAITVGAIDAAEGMASYSNYGTCVAILAPAGSTRAAWVTTDTSTQLAGGTSNAAPHVAGVMALYLAANPAATPAQVRSALLGGATSGAVKSVKPGTPNLLVYSGIAGGVGAPPSPPDTTSAAPPPPPTDQLPIANFVSSCTRGVCTFDAGSSSDDRGIARYTWNLGDGSTPVTGETLVRHEHTYGKKGRYRVTLTVTDIGGQQSSRTANVNVRKL